MNKIRLIAFMLLLLANACATVDPNALYDACLPKSRQASFFESTYTGETMVRATGKGYSVEEAVEDSKKAAIWFLMFAGEKPLLKSIEAKNNIKSVQCRIFDHSDQYIRWQSDIKSKKKVGSFTFVDILFRIDIKGLSDFLITQSIIESVEEISSDIGLPSIAVLAQKDDSINNTAISVMKEYLLDRDYEVFINEGHSQTDSIIDKVSSLIDSDTDKFYSMALKLGSDVYIKIKDIKLSKGSASGVSIKKVSLMADAYETVTNKQLGATSGSSPERRISSYEPLVKEATHMTADKIISQIQKCWIKQSKSGKPFKLSIFTSPDNKSLVERDMYSALKKMTNKIKILASGKNQISYLAYIKNINNAHELYMSLSTNYSGSEMIEKILSKGAFLIIKVGEGDYPIEMDQSIYQ